MKLVAAVIVESGACDGDGRADARDHGYPTLTGWRRSKRSSSSIGITDGVCVAPAKLLADIKRFGIGSSTPSDGQTSTRTNDCHGMSHHSFSAAPWPQELVPQDPIPQRSDE
jgi:hypothetical protein